VKVCSLVIKQGFIDQRPRTNSFNKDTLFLQKLVHYKVILTLLRVFHIIGIGTVLPIRVRIVMEFKNKKGRKINCWY
jgi:hypothetical protein